MESDLAIRQQAKQMVWKIEERRTIEAAAEKYDY